MNLDEKFCKLAGICRHEMSVTKLTLECKHCHAPMLFPWQQNIDYSADPTAVLRVMREREDFQQFCDESEYDDITWTVNGNPYIGIDTIIDHAVLLPRAAVEFLEKEATNGTNQ